MELTSRSSGVWDRSVRLGGDRDRERERERDGDLGMTYVDISRESMLEVTEIYDE